MNWLSGGLTSNLPRCRRFFSAKVSFSMMGLIISVLALGLWAGPEPVAARTGPAAAFNPEKQFTITKIEPDAAKEEVVLIAAEGTQSREGIVV